MKCLIIDDEPIAHKILEDHISRCKDLIVVSNFYNSSSAKEFLKRSQIDLIFLDIQMPGIDGLTFLRTLKEKPITIFTTAYLEHAIEAFDLGVIDYLVKPIRFERFLMAVNKAREFYQIRNGILASDKETNERLVIKSGTKKVFIEPQLISHIKASKDYILIYSKGKMHVVRSTMSNILGLLPHGKFARIHKSYIVNLSKIRLIFRNKLEVENVELPIGKVYKKKIKSILNSLNKP